MLINEAGCCDIKQRNFEHVFFRTQYKRHSWASDKRERKRTKKCQKYEYHEHCAISDD